jgi:endonuclease YncB( thermonuclease family)
MHMIDPENRKPPDRRPATSCAAVSPHWDGSLGDAIRMLRRIPGGWTRRIAYGFLGLVTWWGATSRADDAIAVGRCRLVTVGTGVVDAVIDASTIVLDAGREVRLAAIDVPGRRADDARHLLDGLIGQQVALRNIAPDTDRYGRIRAQVFASGEGGERWMQSELIARGAARVAARVGSRACATELLARESAARNAKLGLWGEPYYAVKSAEDPAAIAADRGGFAIVEGKVLSVRESGATIYVNFGRRWSQDFTVTLLKRNERSFAAEGVEPKRLERHRVRVRGFVEERGGPWIEAVRPEQIEIIE